jgi:hypothetical protein
MRLGVTMTVRWIVPIGLACGLGVYALLTFIPQPGRPNAPLQDALARWQARQPAHYRLVVQEDTADSACRQVVEVLHEHIQTVQEDRCGHDAAWTVSSLLDWIAFRAHPTSACDSSSIACFCYVHNTTNVVYDPQLGYPYAVTYQRTLAPNWDFLKYWQRLWGYRALPKCATGVASQTLTIRVVSLTALP